jgi:hypothetical protein
MGAVWLPAKVVQELFGHRTVSVTMDIFLTCFPLAKDHEEDGQFL